MKTLKRFIHYYAPYRAIFFLDLLCATMISAIDLAYPQILRTLTNTLFTKSSSTILSALIPIAIGLFLMYVLQSLCKYYVSCQGHMMGARMERDMRQQLFDHYEQLSFSYYDQHNSGQMMSKLVSDLFDISEFHLTRTTALARYLKIRYFNPHSRGGSDAIIYLLSAAYRISIHAPTRGATLSNAILSSVLLFQSTLPRGERRP